MTRMLDGERAQVVVVGVLTVLCGAVLGVAQLTQALIAASGEFAAATRTALARNAVVLAFGLAKAASNLVVGAAADACGRRRAMIGGWALALLLPALMGRARGGGGVTWAAVVAASAVLGAQQGAVWSTAIFATIDRLGAARRAVAVGLAETLLV